MSFRYARALSGLIALAVLATACAAPAATPAPAAPAATTAPEATPATEATAEPAAAEATGTPDVAAATEAPTEEALVEVGATATPDTATAAGGDLSGEISLNFASNDKQTWDAVAKAYMAKHPNVKVTVDLKPGEGYQEYIRAQFAGGVPKASLVNANVVADLINDHKFLDLSAYLDKTNPYTNKPWRDSMSDIALENMRNPSTGEIAVLNLETVQTLWFYNQTAFEKAGILAEAQEVAKTDTNQPTWTQFMGWCDKLKAAGYIPVAIEGDFDSFWSGRFGWMAREYLDQYTRDEADLVRAQPGDWNFREGVDDKWELNTKDVTNDDSNKITFNNARKMIALRDGKQRVDSEAFRELYTNFKDFATKCAPPGWVGTKDAYPLFLTQKAAIRLDGAWFLTQFEKNIRSLAEGTYISGSAAEGQPTPTPLPADQSVTQFEVGSFNNPTMDGKEVDAPARTIEVNIGFWGVPKKDQAQNDLEMDFLMYLTSPEGYGIYLQNKLDPENAQGGINGPPVVKDVQLPPEFADKFAQLKLIGNTEKDTAGTYRARGIADYQPSVREWADLAQQYFTDKITLDEFLKQYQASVERLFPEILSFMKLTDADLAAPEKKPASLQ